MRSPHIDACQFGKIVIDGQLYTKDVILLPDRVIGNWWRRDGHFLQLSDLDTVLFSPLEELVVGQGAYSRMQIAPEVNEALEKKGIKLINCPTKEACQEYNRRSQDKKVAAALHLTC